MSARPPRQRVLRLGAAGCFAAALACWLAPGAATAAPATSGPTKTAWYDRSGTQNFTGETTPAAAQPGELEVSYVPAQATVPQQTLPSAPAIPGAPVAPPQGTAGGNSLGYALTFAAVDYELPMEVGGQSIDPSSITALLTLALDQASSANVSDGDLLACPTVTTLWSAGGDQDASQAPQYSCSQAVSGNVDSATHTVSFALTAAQENSLTAGTFSLVIVPSNTPAGGFQAVFSPPSTTSLTVTDESPLGNPNGNLDGSFPGGDQSGALDLSGLPGAPSLQSFTPQAAVVPTPSSSRPGSPTAAFPGTRLAAGTGAVLRGGLGSSAQRAMALAVLLGLGTLLVLASSRQARPPRSLRNLAATASRRGAPAP